MQREINLTESETTTLAFLSLTYSNRTIRSLNRLLCVNILESPTALLIERIREFLPDEYNNALRTCPKLFKSKIVILPILDKAYPEELRKIVDPPITLFLQGNLGLLNNTLIGIVGTRKPSTFSRIWIGKICAYLSQEKFVTVSGMATGIDSAVHANSLKNGTIGVVAHGFNHAYPRKNKKYFDLSKEKSNLLLISEHPPERTARKHYFIKRNRIIAALSNCLLFVEGGEKSGGLSTARYSLKFNKPTFFLDHALQSNNKGVLELMESGAINVTSQFPVYWHKSSFHRNIIEKINHGWIYLGNGNWFKVDVDNFLKESKLPV